MHGLDTLEVYQDLGSFSKEQSRELTDVLNKVYKILREEVAREQYAKLAKKEDISELKQVISNLALAQEKTEQRLNNLALAQEKTEQRLNNLALAQEKTEQQLNRLAIAQENTEKELQKLTKTVGKLQVEVGGMSNTFGYVMEDRAIKTLPRLLKKDFHLEISEMGRDNIEYDDGNYDEINILGQGIKDNKEILIIGEAKYQLSRKNIDQFLKVVKRVKLVKDLPIFRLMVCASAAPNIRKYAKENNITIYYSYQLDL